MNIFDSQILLFVYFSVCRFTVYDYIFCLFWMSDSRTQATAIDLYFVLLFFILFWRFWYGISDDIDASIA